MTLIFDLDDTLYEEITYVKSGFRAVSDHLYKIFKIPKNDSYNSMLEILELEGRGKIFDKMLNEYKLNSKKNVRECLTVYRLHNPNIILYDSAKRCLDRFSDIPKYIVTDGNKIVQRRKINSLNLYKIFKRIFITHQYGLKYSKPSSYYFEKIAKIENIKPNKIVFIGDDPNKDFVGIKPLGFKTIRVMTGNHRFEKLKPKYEADISVKSLDEINQMLLNEIGAI